MMRWTVLLLLALLTAPVRAAPSSSERLQKALTILEAEKERLHIPGLAVAIVDHDRVALMKGLGVRDLATNAPVDSLTVFPIGSCTKAFTGMAAIVAQAEGKLSLDDSPR